MCVEERRGNNELIRMCVWGVGDQGMNSCACGDGDQEINILCGDTKE